MQNVGVYLTALGSFQSIVGLPYRFACTLCGISTTCTKGKLRAYVLLLKGRVLLGQYAEVMGLDFIRIAWVHQVIEVLFDNLLLPSACAASLSTFSLPTFVLELFLFCFVFLSPLDRRDELVPLVVNLHRNYVCSRAARDTKAP